MNLNELMALLGLGAGFLSGLLGIGGGIIMAPLLLYTPPLVGCEPLSMKVVAGLTIVQGLAACLSGVIAHRRFHFVSSELTSWMGATIFVAALIGGAGAKHVANHLLLGAFSFLAIIAAGLMCVPPSSDSNTPNIKNFTFSRPRAVSVASAIGLLGGLVGQGGSFILIPLMTSFMQVPTRIAIGSNLGIVFLASLAGFIGKATTGQIVWTLALPMVITVIPAAQFGSFLSRKVPVTKLRFLLALCIAIAAVRLGVSAFNAGNG